DLAIHDFESQENRRLTRNTGLMHGEYALTSLFSRDGRRIAYTWNAPAEGASAMELRVIGIDGTGQRPVSRTAGRLEVDDWLPDGRSVLVTSVSGGTFELQQILIPDGTARTIRTAPGWYGGTVLVSNDGRYAAYDAQVNGTGEQMEIRVMSLNGD